MTARLPTVAHQAPACRRSRAPVPPGVRHPPSGLYPHCWGWEIAARADPGAKILPKVKLLLRFRSRRWRMEAGFLSISLPIAPFSRRLWGMKRWILAVVFLIGAAGLVHADYVKILVNLGVSKEKMDNNQMGLPGMMPGGMMPGGMGP